MKKKKLKNFINKFKMQSKPLSISFLAVTIIYFIFLVLFTRSILSLVGIENLLRALVLTLLYVYLISLMLFGVVLLFLGKKKTLIALLIIACIIIPIMGVGSFYIDKTYGIINKVQKKYINYTSYMVSLNETVEYKKIGRISAKEDPTGYIIPELMIKEFKITGEIVEYDDYISMMAALYDKEIDALFVAESYVTMFSSYEKFENIAKETKVVYEKSKELENVDSIQYTAKDLTEPFTMLLMGVDATGDGIASSSSFNGDTLMLITFNPKTLSATMFSIPRDTFVPISCNGNQESKINSSAYGGTTCVVNTIQNLIGINIDYYVKINFTGVVKLVDDLGGIYVDVPMTFCEQDSERRFGEHEICLEKGYQKLNGEQALALSRHRKTLPLGDFQRVQNQQLVVEAMGKSLKNLESLDAFYQILDDVINNIDTNISTAQILSLYNVVKNILINQVGDTKFSIQKTYLTGYDLTAYLPSMGGYVYTFQYYRQSLDEIVNAMKVNLELESPTIIKNFRWSANENYEPYVAGKTYYNEKRRELLPNFIGSTISIVETWTTERNVELKKETVTSTSPLYNATLPNGYIINQSAHAGILADTISSLTIYIIDKNGTTDASVENEKKDEEKDETLPNFIGKTIDEFDKWASSLIDANLIINKEPLSPDDVLEIDDLEANKIYKQSSSDGTKLSDISTLTVYYYKEQE